MSGLPNALDGAYSVGHWGLLKQAQEAKISQFDVTPEGLGDAAKKTTHAMGVAGKHVGKASLAAGKVVGKVSAVAGEALWRGSKVAGREIHEHGPDVAKRGVEIGRDGVDMARRGARSLGEMFIALKGPALEKLDNVGDFLKDKLGRNGPDVGVDKDGPQLSLFDQLDPNQDLGHDAGSKIFDHEREGMGL